MTIWIEDANSNKCSMEYFGSVEAALKALDSLIDCRNCINCSYCVRCVRCSHCSYCSDCSYCSNCSGCSDCSNCLDCSNCSECADCLICSDCSYCFDCFDCSDCSRKSEIQSNFTPPVIPKVENIHQRVYEAVSQPNALQMQSWHTCDTTHCRAGWVVHLAGEAGYALERFHNTPLAAQLIYEASGYKINPGRFYDSTADALADMKRLAGAENDK